MCFSPRRGTDPPRDRERGMAMSIETRNEIRNVAIIAHVDHGKTTLVDAMLWQSEIFDLFIDLDASEDQLDFPVLYCNARRGTCRTEPDGPDTTLEPLFEAILSAVPAPRFDPAFPLQLLITNLDWDDYVGRLAIGRVFNGNIVKGQEVSLCRHDGTIATAKVTGLYGYQGLKRVDIADAGPGDIVAVAGLDDVWIGETISSRDDPRALPHIKVDEPTIAMVIGVNTRRWPVATASTS